LPRACRKMMARGLMDEVKRVTSEVECAASANCGLARATAPVVPGAAGSTVDVEFRVPASLNSGAFLLSLGVSEADQSGELVPLDRRYDAILVRVLNERPVWGLVDLHARCRVLGTRVHASA